jgi:NADPH:quinone reductase-like Zn-dependent oxidoreductase
MAVVAGGGQAELAIVHESAAMPVPDELEWTAAGGVPEVFTTAHDAVFTQAGLTLGERLLVHGAAGGVGMAAVQLGTMAGARVTATVRNEQAREQIAALDVKALAPEGFEEQGPFDVILELVGGPNLAGNLKALAMRGRIVVIGISAGAKAELDLRMLMGKRGSIHASTLRARSLEDKALAARAVERCVLPGFASGDLSVPVTATFPLEDAAAAYERFKEGGKLGKIVLEMCACARPAAAKSGSRCRRTPNRAATPRTSRRARGTPTRTPAWRRPRRASGRCRACRGRRSTA